ncbi:MAG: PAS domain S-box protein [Candidatus Melainabacteria bacterium]|nr:PAS domain S-box protein [Candidatus Melainabacteria bacterium]
MPETERLQQELLITHRHLDMMTSIAAAATEPGSLEHLVRRSLEIIATANVWVLGQYWTVRPEGDVIVCSSWYHSSAVLNDIRASSEDRRFSIGVGLPGRIWSNSLPLLINDIQTASNMTFLRRAAATKSNLKSVFGFPVKNGPFVIGVLEFFSFEPISASESDNRFYEKLGVYLATLFAQKDAEAANRRDDIINKTILNHAANAFVGINEAGTITQWTEQTTRMFGWEKDEVIGLPIVDVIIPERYKSAHINGLFRYLSRRTANILEKRIHAPAITKSGEEIRVELYIFPIEAQDIKSFGAFIVDLGHPRETEPDIVLD